MASSGIFKKAGRRNFYLRIYDPRTQTEYRESAHTADEQLARERLAEAARAVTLQQYEPPAKRRARIERERLTLHRAIAEYLVEMINRGASQAYCDWASCLLFNFLEYFESARLQNGEYVAPTQLPACRLRRAKRKSTPESEVAGLLEPARGDRLLRLVEPRLLESFKAYLLQVRGADSTSVNSELKVLHMFGKWVTKRASLTEDPFASVRNVVDNGAEAGRALTSPEFASLVRAADADLQPWLLVVGLHGLRRGEANHLQPVDIDLEQQALSIRVHRDTDGRVLWSPKFGKERRVPFAPGTLPFMARLHRGPVDAEGHVLGVHDRRKAIKRAVARSGIGGHVRPHDLRHSAYTALKTAMLRAHERELALSDLRLIFGHADRSMDQVYDHPTVERLRRVMALMPLAEGVQDLLTVEPAPVHAGSGSSPS